MKNKARALVASVIGIVFFPAVVSAQQSWGLGGSVDQNGNIGISGCIGSTGACSGGSGVGAFALSNPYGLPQGSILGIISNLLFWLLAVFAILGIVGFVISGIFYLVAAGDESTMEKGKEGIKWSIIGIIVGLSGFLIMQAVALLLSGASSTF